LPLPDALPDSYTLPVPDAYSGDNADADALPVLDSDANTYSGGNADALLVLDADSDADGCPDGRADLHSLFYA